ncbi:methyltransferase [Labrys okinawensis]|uniref:methyltransferase n=1 Tax=Labrys okinawensis TaxID=346911 RepID=UPI0039BD2B72
MTTAAQESPSVALMRLVNGYQVSQAIHVAAVLGIADHLIGGARRIEDLAQATATDSGSLYRLLRALAAVDIFREEEERVFALTPMARCLGSDVNDPVGPWAAFIGRPYVRRAWDELLYSVQTGDSAFSHVHGTGVWAYRAQHPEEGALFDKAMTAISRQVCDAVVAAYDFAGAGRVVDVGGGEGALLAGILNANPASSGVLFELEHVAARAADRVAAMGLASRVEIVSGSFFEQVPGGDIHVLKGILHDWDDRASADILHNCREAIAANGRLLVIERLIAPPNQGAEAKFSDLNMLVSPGGQERTREQFAGLFGAAGFRLARLIATGTRMTIIEGEPMPP